MERVCENAGSNHVSLPEKTPFRRYVVSVIPFLVVGGLIYGGVYLKPVVKEVNVAPAVIERGDYLYGIAQVGNDRLIAVGSHGKIWAGSGSADSWTRLPSPIKTTLQDIDSWDAQHAVAVGDQGEIIASQDGGKTWSVSSAPKSRIANKLLRVRTAGEGVAWAVGEAGAVLRSGDHGNTWERAHEEEDLAWNGIAVRDRHVWIVGEYGNVHSSTDGGATWTKRKAPVKGSLMAVTFKDDAQGIAVGVNGMILSTSDGGANWVARSANTKEHLYDVIWDGERWAAVGDKGVLVMSDAKGEVWNVADGKENDRRWHTKILKFGNGYAVSGASFYLTSRN